MTKNEYLEALERELGSIVAEERSDILLELKSHIEDTLAARSDLTEEEVVARLPSPEGVAAGYREANGGPGEGKASPGSANRASRRRDEGPRAFPFGDADDFFRYARGEPGTLEGEVPGARRLVVRSRTADISVRPGIALRYSLRGWWKDGEGPLVSGDGETLELDLGSDCEQAEIEAPTSVFDIEIGSGSGDVSVDAPEGSSVSIRTISGDVEIDGDASAVSIASSSGDVALRGRAREGFVRTASGDVSVIAQRGSHKVHSSSGEIDIEVASAEAVIEAASASGDLRLRLPGGALPAVTLETVSGDASGTDLPGLRRDESARGRKRFTLEGGPGSIRAKTISGDATAERKPVARPERVERP